MYLLKRSSILVSFLFLIVIAVPLFAENDHPVSTQFMQIDTDQQEIIDWGSKENDKIQGAETQAEQREQREKAVREQQRKKAEALALLKLQRQKQALEALRAEQQKQREQRIVEAKKAKERRITAHIDLSQQRMKVYKGDNLIHTWRVSTAKKGYVTPVGNYHPQYVVRMHYSKRYHNSPMPYSIFFKGNFAIHGTNSIRRLGRRASHGCVRLHPKHAKKLYALVRKYGKENTFIRITY